MRGETRPAVFPNRRGHRLFGIVHEPLGVERSDLAVVLLSPGVKNRVAPHRLYVTMAEALAELGFRVLRFDFSGLGDSEGEIGKQYLRDLYGSIQVGCYVEDTLDALAWLRGRHGTSHFIVGGLCGGAITALLAAPGRPDFAGILALGIPVMLDSSDVDVRRYMTAGQSAGLRKGYVRKVLDPKSWFRLLTLQTDLRLLVRSLAAGIPGRRAAAPVDKGPAPVDNANPHFPPALLRTLAQKCPVLLLFSEADRLYWEFKEKFLARHGAAFAAHADLADVEIIRDANHVLTFPAMQEELDRLLRAWINKRFPHPGASTGREPPSGARRDAAAGRARA